MKVLIRSYATLILLCIAGMATAQDVIVKTDNSTILSKVLEITSTEIKYKKWDNQDGPLYSISRSEIKSINYENGEVENFSEVTQTSQKPQPPKVQYLNSYMTKSGGRLYLNGRPLSNYEIQKLVGQEGFQQYQKGRKLGQTGIILDVVGGIALVVAEAINLFSPDLNSNLGPSALDTPAFKTEMTFLIVGCITLGTGILLGVFGSENIEKVAEEYNKKHGNAYSLNISPSLMKCESPQIAYNYGLGLTLTMNF